MKMKKMGQLNPTQLYNMLDNHGLVPKGQSEVAMLRVIQTRASEGIFCVVTEDDSDLVLAATLSYPTSPRSLGFIWVPEVKRLNHRKPDLAELAKDFRAFWFQQGIYRVEAHVPTSRSQTTRTLKAMGFRQETLDSGLRDTVDFGNGPEGILILGMLESDPVRQVQGDALRHVEPILNTEECHG